VLVVGRDDQVNSVLAPLDDDELVEAADSDDPAPVVLGSWVVQLVRLPEWSSA
jgi:hypothetical protein